jgi:hypothetical protein
MRLRVDIIKTSYYYLGVAAEDAAGQLRILLAHVDIESPHRQHLCFGM